MIRRNYAKIIALITIQPEAVSKAEGAHGIHGLNGETQISTFISV